MLVLCNKCGRHVALQWAIHVHLLKDDEDDECTDSEDDEELIVDWNEAGSPEARWSGYIYFHLVCYRKMTTMQRLGA